MDSATGRPHIRVGIGGWTFAPGAAASTRRVWRRPRKLHYASRQLTAIEVNGTFYSTFRPATFAKWHDETPDGFLFSLKAHRLATHRRYWERGRSSRFVERALRLKDKLGPSSGSSSPKVLQIGLLALLPRAVDGPPRAMPGRALSTPFLAP